MRCLSLKPPVAWASSSRGRQRPPDGHVRYAQGSGGRTERQPLVDEVSGAREVDLVLTGPAEPASLRPGSAHAAITRSRMRSPSNSAIRGPGTRQRSVATVRHAVAVKTNRHQR